MKRPQQSMQRIGNLIFNKIENQEDEKAWKKVKKYIIDLEQCIYDLQGYIDDFENKA